MGQSLQAYQLEQRVKKAFSTIGRKICCALCSYVQAFVKESGDKPLPHRTMARQPGIPRGCFQTMVEIPGWINPAFSACHNHARAAKFDLDPMGQVRPSSFKTILRHSPTPRQPFEAPTKACVRSTSSTWDRFFIGRSVGRSNQ